MIWWWSDVNTYEDMPKFPNIGIFSPLIYVDLTLHLILLKSQKFMHLTKNIEKNAISLTS